MLPRAALPQRQHCTACPGNCGASKAAGLNHSVAVFWEGYSATPDTRSGLWPQSAFKVAPLASVGESAKPSSTVVTPLNCQPPSNALATPLALDPHFRPGPNGNCQL